MEDGKSQGTEAQMNGQNSSQEPNGKEYKNQSSKLQIQHAAMNQAMERIYAITESNPMS